MVAISSLDDSEQALPYHVGSTHKGVLSRSDHLGLDYKSLSFYENPSALTKIFLHNARIEFCA
jgi:hypothetical protein